MKKILIFSLIGLFVLGIVIAAEVIGEEDKWTSDGDISYKRSSSIDFFSLSNGFSMNGIEITTESNGGNTILEDKETKVTSKFRFIPRIIKDYGSDEVEYVWNKAPTTIREIPYFTEPSEWLKYVGGDRNLSELSELCPTEEGRCGHGDYTYYTFYWEDEEITLNTKKVDLDNGDVWNMDLTKNKPWNITNGFKVTGLTGKTSLNANDVITSGGEIWINGTVTCDEFFKYVINSAPECHYLNNSKNNSENNTALTMICKTHINGTLNECNGYNIKYMVDLMPDFLGTTIIHSNSRMNMSQGSISWDMVNRTAVTQFSNFVPYEADMTNFSQYFENFGFYGIDGLISNGYFNITGNNVNFNWILASASQIAFGTNPNPRMNGVGFNGITTYGDQIGFPIDVEGKVSIDATESVNNICFYSFGQITSQLILTGVECKTNGGNVAFMGALFAWGGYLNLTFIDTIRVDTPGLMDQPFFGTGESNFYWTPNYIINASGSDEAVISTINITTISDGTYPDFDYSTVGSSWDEAILYYHHNQGIAWGNGVKDESYYTARMSIVNSSYFPINSSLLISDTTTNGQKDMIKIPYAIELNPNSDFKLGL